MNRCPISYEPTAGTYSASGLKRLSRNLEVLVEFPYSAEEQVREATNRAAKMSIQGVQPKLSVKLIYSKDRSLTYFIKRFDRIGRNKKLALEDFAQLTGKTRETKYDSSMERVAKAIEDYCTFPVIEKIKLYRLTLFNFLVGNEDMHLKNFSLITRDSKVELSPAYDLLNTSIAIDNPVEEIALPIAGKKRKLTKELLVDYFGKERLGLREKVITNVMGDIAAALSRWSALIDISFLSGAMKEKYKVILASRSVVLKI